MNTVELETRFKNFLREVLVDMTIDVVGFNSNIPTELLPGKCTAGYSFCFNLNNMLLLPPMPLKHLAAAYPQQLRFDDNNEFILHSKVKCYTDDIDYFVELNYFYFEDHFVEDQIDKRADEQYATCRWKLLLTQQEYATFRRLLVEREVNMCNEYGAIRSNFEHYCNQLAAVIDSRQLVQSVDDL